MLRVQGQVFFIFMAQYLTKERYDELTRELQRLKDEGRHDVALRLKHAKSLGDRSENSEYQETRDAQASLERRIRELDDLLKHCQIIASKVSSDRITVGSHVQLKKNNETVRYTIVGSNEAQPSLGLISNESPVGRTLLGRRAGEAIEVTTFKGVIRYEIMRIE